MDHFTFRWTFLRIDILLVKFGIEILKMIQVHIILNGIKE
jgi:hypothetical protein